MRTTHKIVFGDARKMSTVNDQSVHLIVTSPPYWQLKDYGNENQIGFDDSYEDYINNLNLVWSECRRVLHDGCRMCINIGDQFARSVYYGRYKVIPIRTEIIKFCETIGFDYMGSIIWQKVTNCNTSGGATIMGSFPNPRNGIVKIDYEFILLFKKHGKPPKINKDIKESSSMTKEEWNTFFNGHWNFSGEKQDKHIAMFPEELPRRLIKMFSFENEVVLDPFLGSGTTSLAAMKLNRNSIGYEINSEYKNVIEEKLHSKADLFNDSDISFSENNDLCINDNISTLPYLFHDPLKLDKKIDPKLLNFGSKIDKNSKTTGKFYKVSEIIDIDLVKLDQNLSIKLLGVAPINDRKDEALNFLNQKVKGKQAFLKFDEEKYDQSNNLLAYLYLKNKTFINAHLIKYGFAKLDSVYPISNKSLLKLEK